MSRRRGWRYYRNLYRQFTRELAAAAANSPAPTLPPTDAPAPPSRPRLRPTRQPRPVRQFSPEECEALRWYFYGSADDPPPALALTLSESAFYDLRVAAARVMARGDLIL